MATLRLKKKLVRREAQKPAPKYSKATLRAMAAKEVRTKAAMQWFVDNNQVMFLDGVLRPMEIGIIHKLKYPETVSKGALKRVLRILATNNDIYQSRLKAGGFRYDLNGNEAGEI